jgi:hypothetical protein
MTSTPAGSNPTPDKAAASPAGSSAGTSNGISGTPEVSEAAEAVPPIRRDRFHELVHIPQNARAVGEEFVRASAFGHACRAGDRPYVAPRVEGVAGCDEGAALLRRLDDNDRLAHPRHDAVPSREMPRERRLAEIIFRNDRTPPSHFIEQRMMLLRIHNVYATP